MAVRTDLTVDWEASPRIITIADPSTEITIQDLHDSLTSIEQSPEGIDRLKLIDSAGKENLGGGVFVGITANLQNAQLAFEARPSPNYIQCKVYKGNLVAVDTNGDPISPIKETAYTQVTLIQSTAASIVEQSVADTATQTVEESVTTAPDGSLGDAAKKAKQAAQLAFINSL